MIPSLSIAASGMVDAANRLSTSASRIVRNQTSGFAADPGLSPEVASSTGVASPSGLARETPRATPGSVLYTPSYAEDVVTMKLASAAYKANAKILKASADLSRELIDTLR